MKYSIFLVDDDETILELTKTYLEDFKSCKIHSFRDPQQALYGIQLFGAPDLIITDLNLPRMNGLKFLTEVDWIAPETKAIIFSASKEVIIGQSRYPVILKSPASYECLLRMVKTYLPSVC